MKRQPRILAGTALSLLMAASPLMAAPMPGTGVGESARAPFTARTSAPIVLAQAEALPQDQSSEEQLPRKKHRKAEQPAPEAAPRAQEAAPAEEQPTMRKKNRKEAPAPEQPAQQEFAPAEAPAEAMPERPRKKNHKEAPAAEQPSATQELAPAPAEAAPEKPRKKNHKEAPAAEQPSATQELAPAPAGAAPEKPRKKNHKEAPAAEQPAAPQELTPAPAEAAPEKAHKKNSKQAPAEAVTPTPAEKPVEIAPAPAEAAPEQPHKKNRKEAPAAEQPAPSETTAPTPAEKPAVSTPAPGEAPAPAEAAPSGTAPAEQPAEAKPERPRKKGGQQAPAAEQPAASGEAVTPGEPAQVPVEAEGRGKPVNPAKEAPVPGQEQAAPGEATGEGKTMPAPDSQKAAPAEGQEQGAQDLGKRGNRRPQPAEAGPPPADDKAAQQEVQPEKVEPVTAEQGKRVKERPVDLRRQERPKGAEVVKEFGDRVIIQLNNQVMVESNDRPRMRHGARDVYYEDLPRGRTRETIERGDGTRVVTIRNAYGDVIRRSRIMPDGREYVLSYVDEGDYDRVRDWRDPGRDLPPLRLEIPEDDYILTSDRVRDPDMYYRFLEQPPVERVERLYSVDEVKRSARIRDKTRRIDLDTITFDFGSATIAESEITRLEGVANAMERILEKNPAETFLIEGHTDAVGSDLANLALSDKRAEAVAAALTNVFGIPPENLATQGYGEQFLKVKTQAPERQNRRVAIRRITPLVAPVASNR